MSKVFLFLLTIVVVFSSCEVDDPEIPNEEELITTVTYTLTPEDGSAPVVLNFRDLDGEGGNAPEVTVSPLKANLTYTGVLTLLNETESPAENITEEIEEEDAEHQFFFDTAGGITVSYEDQDASGFPVGLRTQVTTGAAGSATIGVTLRHEPNKSGSGVSEGNITNAGGETDIAVSFAVNVE